MYNMLLFYNSFSPSHSLIIFHCSLIHN